MIRRIIRVLPVLLLAVLVSQKSVAQSSIRLSAANVTVNCSEFLDVPVRSEGFVNIMSLQGSMSWDTSFLRLEGLSNFGAPALGLNSSNFNLSAGSGKLAFSWNDATLKGVSLPDTASLFVLRFRIITQSVIKAAVRITGDPVILEAINASLQPLTVNTVDGSVDLRQFIENFNPLRDTLIACGDSLVLDAGDGFSTYTWDPPGSISRFRTVRQSGTYNVTVTNALGCRASDRMLVSLGKADIRPNDTTICKGSALQLNATGTGNIIRWSTGETTTVITVRPEVNSVYGLSISNGLAVCTDSIRVSVIPPDTSLSVAGPLSFCSGRDSTVLSAPAGLVYQWFRNDTLISGAVQRQFVVKTTGRYRALLTGQLGCIATTRTIQVTVNPNPATSFSFTVAPCTYNVSFLNTTDTSIRISSYRWNFGNGDSSAQFSPLYTYKDPGSYNVRLTVSSQAGCESTFSRDQLFLARLPKAEFTVSKDSQCLRNNSYVFTYSGVNDTTLRYRWEFGDGRTSTQSPATLTYADTGRFRVILRVTSSTTGCIDTIGRNVTVLAMPVARLTATDSSLCEGSILVLTASGGGTYRWFRNGVVIPGSTKDTLQVRDSARYSVEAISAAGCSTAAPGSIGVKLISKPKLNFASSGNCVNTVIKFINISDTTGLGKITWSWNFGDGGTSNSVSPEYIYKKGGDLGTTLFYSNSLCPTHRDSVFRVVRIVEEVNERYRNAFAVVGTPTALDARDSARKYEWSPATGLSSTTIEKPRATLQNDQAYIIKVETRNGCVVFDSLLVKVSSKSDIYVPKAFSPNGDGQNDRLFPIAVGIQELRYFRIYNRWGNLIYDSRDLSTSGGWDGTYKGQPQPMETYVWVAEGVDITGAAIKRGGNTLLIR